MSLRQQTGLFLLLGVLLGMLTGCRTPEDVENESTRPWNTPRSWETGLPGFQQDRR